MTTSDADPQRAPGRRARARPRKGRRGWAAALGLAGVAGVAALLAAVLPALGPEESHARAATAVRHDRVAAATPTPTTTPGTPPGQLDMAGRAPLTGLPAVGDLARPSVAVKVSNTPDAHPHRGLADADIVFVEPIAGATTRLAAIFHSRLPATAGPVRSLRPMDAPLVGPTAGVLANTMAAPWVLEYVDATADVANLGTMRVPRGTYLIDTARAAPNHVFARPSVLLTQTTRTEPPAPYFDYAHGPSQSSAALDGRPASSVTVGYGGSSTATWDYDPVDGLWRRSEEWSPHLLESGEQVAATNVMVLRTGRDWTLPQAGPEMTVLDLIDASGTLELFTGDAVVSGRWSKAGVNEPFRFTTDDGAPLLLAPGTTWVEAALDSMSVTIR